MLAGIREILWLVYKLSQECLDVPEMKHFWDKLEKNDPGFILMIAQINSRPSQKRR